MQGVPRSGKRKLKLCWWWLGFWVNSMSQKPNVYLKRLGKEKNDLLGLAHKKGVRNLKTEVNKIYDKGRKKNNNYYCEKLLQEVKTPMVNEECSCNSIIVVGVLGAVSQQIKNYIQRTGG